MYFFCVPDNTFIDGFNSLFSLSLLLPNSLGSCNSIEIGIEIGKFIHYQWVHTFLCIRNICVPWTKLTGLFFGRKRFYFLVTDSVFGQRFLFCIKYILSLFCYAEIDPRKVQCLGNWSVPDIDGDVLIPFQIKLCSLLINSHLQICIWEGNGNKKNPLQLGSHSNYLASISGGWHL